MTIVPVSQDVSLPYRIAQIGPPATLRRRTRALKHEIGIDICRIPDKVPYALAVAFILGQVRTVNAGALLTVVATTLVCHTSGVSAESRKGIFLGGGFCALMINGDGTYGAQKFRVDKRWSDRIQVTETAGTLAVDFDRNGIVGLNWTSRQLQGLQSEIGWGISESFAVTLSYRHYFTKRGSQTLTWSASPSGAFAGVRGVNEFASCYRHRTFQLLANYYPGGGGFFAIAGLEYVSLQLDLVSEWTTINYDQPVTGKPYSGHGEDEDFGLVLGAGYERTLRGHCRLVSSVTYSFAAYSGDNLLARFHIGGPSVDIRLRYCL